MMSIADVNNRIEREFRLNSQLRERAVYIQQLNFNYVSTVLLPFSPVCSLTRFVLIDAGPGHTFQIMKRIVNFRSM